MGTAFTTKEQLKALAPTRENTVSAVLNGIGNATMILAIALGLRELSKSNRNNTVLFASVATAVLGAVWGWREAKQITKYRNALVEEIGSLRKDVEALRAENAGWREKHAKQEAQNVISQPGLVP